MAQIVIATADQALREELATPLLEGGYAVVFASTWSRLVELLTQPITRLVLVDARTRQLRGGRDDADLLLGLARSLPHEPRVLVAAGELPPLEAMPGRATALLRSLGRRVIRTIPRDEIRLLKLLGVGSRPLQVLANLARSPIPVCLEGERGTEKMRVAQALHRLGGGGAFIPLKAPGSTGILQGDAAASGEGEAGGLHGHSLRWNRLGKR